MKIIFYLDRQVGVLKRTFRDVTGSTQLTFTLFPAPEGLGGCEANSALEKHGSSLPQTPLYHVTVRVPRL